jgi:hypothetical protein
MHRFIKKGTNMSDLYIARCTDLFKKQTPDVNAWASIYKMIPPNVSLVDRCNYVKMPYRFKTYEPFTMPTDLSNFSMTYEECCLKRAQELIDLSKLLNKPITIFYSGGIDSTTVLISFMKLLNAQELKDRIRVAMSVESIDENVNFYYNHVRDKCTIISSEYMSSLIDGSSIIVGGEHNDQLFGSDIVGQIYRHGNYENLHQPYSREFITGWMRKFMQQSEPNKWFDILDEHIKTQAPCEITTNFHFLWWYNFCFKWQCVYFRMLTRMNLSNRTMLNDDFLKNYYHHFFSSVEFQKWSMLNHDLKIGKDWTDYKLESKNFIYEFNKDENYRDYKIKSGSLYTLFLQKRAALGITDNFEFIEEFNIDEFYQPDNSFC